MAPSLFKTVKKAITGTKTDNSKKDTDRTKAVTSKDATSSKPEPIFSSPALDNTTDDNENAIASSSSSSDGSFVRVPSSTATAEQGQTASQRRRDRRATAATRDVVNDLGYHNFNQLRKKRYGGGLGLDIYKKLKGGKQK